MVCDGENSQTMFDLSRYVTSKFLSPQWSRWAPLHAQAIILHEQAYDPMQN